MSGKAGLIKPGLFSVNVNADSRRAEFDIKNEVIVMNGTPVDFVFIGDSIIHMWELNAYFGGKGRIVINRGISGDTSEYVLKRFEADVMQLHPVYAVLEIGANDTWELENYYWIDKLPKPVEYVFEKIIGNIGKIMDICETNRQKLVICSLLPTDSIYTSCKKDRNELIVKINKRLEEMAENRAIYIDYHKHLAGPDGVTLSEGLADDGVHPRSEGYNIMADVLRKTLKRFSVEI